MAELNERIRIFRTIRGYSQNYMAQQLGLSQNAYSKLERGATQISATHLQALAGILGVSTEVLSMPFMRFPQPSPAHSAKELLVLARMYDYMLEMKEAQIEKLEEELKELRKIIEGKQ